MKSLNVHIYPSNMTNESRIFKESKFISKNMDFEKVILLGIWKESLLRYENLEDNIFIKRVSFFNIKSRVFLYLYYFIFVLFYVLINRPKMLNIHTLEFLPLAFFCKLIGIKVIYDTHELETEKANFSESRKKISKLIEKSFIFFTDEIIVVGEAIADEYKIMYPKMKRPFVVLNTPKYQETVRHNIFREKFNIDEQDIVFLYQGVISKSRGIETILESFKSTKHTIVFMGFGDLVDTVKEYSIDCKNIYYHEAVDPKVLLKYTSSADIGFCLIENICKSYDFCMPNKMFEYLMAGIPVIVSDLHELSRFMKKYKAGLIIKSESEIKNLVDSITIDDILVYKKNIEEVKLHYNWEVQEKILKKIYKIEE